ncbi:MAG: hypothetical protein M0Q16_08525, partial [Candidatus Cloacimonetes bacterium]|nr:hypothetical protein [Candidatus Cloacimonadota bacterium]MCK9185402.1 hypothetical protein [Candidatus Cloacimonadota bacterium]
MNSKYLLIIILTALVLVGLYHVFAVGRFNYPEYRLKTGQVAETEIIAPFDFPILKSPQQLSEEQEESIQAMPTPYQLSDDALFEAFSSLDEVWEVIYRYPDLLEDQLSTELGKAGFKIPGEALKFAGNPKQRDLIYEKLRGQIDALYSRGIYEDLKADSLSLWIQEKESRKPISDFLSVDTARDTLAAIIPEAAGLILSLSDELIKANILPNSELREELSQRRLRGIPETEGLVLQNEVIIRKNARVSQSDIDKLESLQAAFLSRNVGKSVFQQTLLVLGMLIYFFMILLLASHYFGVNSLEEKKHTTDFLPVSLGFVLVAVFAILTNHVFSLNNLLIPFALTAIAAAILVSVDYGILYSVCSVLIISPFINWETYTPVILLLSTISTLVLIKRQKAQHEYLTIWFYLVITTTSANLALSLYKSDPINILFRNIGFSVISGAIS